VTNGRQAAIPPVDGDAGTLELDRSVRHDVSYIAASTFDERGEVSLVVSLGGFAHPISAAEIEDHGRRLHTATLQITKAVHGRHPAADHDAGSRSDSRRD
ncbi:MAG TPA: hypothetical protein VMB82_13985, partial [Acidimicrobiales bacterium]|nr:hypothetical protein [Acidimicrobiales bacterium]